MKKTISFVFLFSFGLHAMEGEISHKIIYGKPIRSQKKTKNRKKEERKGSATEYTIQTRNKNVITITSFLKAHNDTTLKETYNESVTMLAAYKIGNPDIQEDDIITFHTNLQKELDKAENTTQTMQAFFTQENGGSKARIYAGIDFLKEEKRFQVTVHESMESKVARYNKEWKEKRKAQQIKDSNNDNSNSSEKSTRARKNKLNECKEKFEYTYFLVDFWQENQDKAIKDVLIYSKNSVEFVEFIGLKDTQKETFTNAHNTLINIINKESNQAITLKELMSGN